MRRPIWPKKLRRGLRSQILLWIVLPVGILVLVLSFISIYGHQRWMRKLVEDRDLALATVAAKQVQERLGRCETALENVRDHEAFRQSESVNYASLLKQVSPQLLMFDGGVGFLGQNGEVVAATFDEKTWAGELQAIMQRSVEESMGRRRSTILATLEGPDSGSPMIALLVPIETHGAAVVGIFSLEDCGITDTLASLTVSDEGSAYLVDGEGTILWHPDESQTGSNALAQLAMDDAELLEPGTGVYVDVAGRDIMLARAPVNQAGWAVIVQEPWGSLVAPIMRYSLVAPVVVLLVALIAVLAIYVGVRQVLQPLEELGRRATKIAWGDFSAIGNPVGGIAEIDELRETLSHMAERIRSYQIAMQSYVAAVGRAQEEERLRLGHELHDDTVQALIVLSQGLERAQREVPSGAEQLSGQLGRLRNLTNATVTDLRRYIGDLRPVYLEDLGLIPALQKLADDLAAHQDIEVGLQVTGTTGRFADEIELAVFRIVQEALTNVEQHAEASRVDVRLEFDADGITVFIEDDGVGFVAPETPGELSERGHFGLMGMQERATLLGGWLSIGSEPHQGTRIVFYLPTSGRT
jgi:signal transduction histidine kinase